MSETISSALAVHHRDTNSGSSNSSRSRMTATARSTTTSFVSVPDDITDEDLDQVQFDASSPSSYARAAYSMPYNWPVDSKRFPL